MNGKIIKLVPKDDKIHLWKNGEPYIGKVFVYIGREEHIECARIVAMSTDYISHFFSPSPTRNQKWVDPDYVDAFEINKSDLPKKCNLVTETQFDTVLFPPVE